MRIRSKVALVGGIPITIAALIALVAWLLLDSAERARGAALIAGAAYRDLAEVMTSRNDYMRAQSQGRPEEDKRFAAAADRAAAQLASLAGRSGDPAGATATTAASDALAAYRRQMLDLVDATVSNDRLVAEMNARAEELIQLTDKARERQHASNADIIASITEGDRRLREAREVVDRARDAQAAVLRAWIDGASTRVPEADAGAREPVVHASAARAEATLKDLADYLKTLGKAAEADELGRLAAAAKGDIARGGGAAAERFSTWLDRLIKINATEQRALHEEVSQLLTYSVQAAETEQATQNIAIATLKLGRRTATALDARDVAALDRINRESRALADTIGTLPISPLIQAEMLDELNAWSERLATTTKGLEIQNGIASLMDGTAEDMIENARKLDRLFVANADRIDSFVRTVLILGAAFGLFVGGFVAWQVARSITEPLQRLQARMIELAANPNAGTIGEYRRRDELGAMARAANFFVSEIARREQDMRRQKERADAALNELRDAQASLIQAEKLATLGQLVAGVAHEINTPVGIALTTSTALDGEVRLLREGAESGSLRRSDLSRTVDRLTEGSRLLFANLNRAADLVHSFKQVAVDRASGERRAFELKGWIRELLVSLSPVLRRSGHEILVDCPEGIVLDTFPGSLAQVITNLVTNARDHAYPDGRHGRLTLDVTQTRPDAIRLVFADDGVGIPPEHQAKVFDPFYTTGRERGSTGLGLHIVHNIVTGTLEGRIQLDSTPGAGTRFTIDLPASLGEATPAQNVA
jgi:signal transduction histidine kinase